jgi:hypothetical protein
LLVWGWGHSFEWWLPAIAGLLIAAIPDLWRFASRFTSPS